MAKTYNPPKAAQNNAKRAIKWKEEHPDEIKGGTQVGWTRARQLADGDALSLDIVKRMAQFNRHRKNSTVDPKYKNEPWRDAGHVAWLLWGGDAGIDWAIRVAKEESMSQEEKSYDNEVSYCSATSFEEYEQQQMAVDAAHEVKEDTELFKVMVENIMYSPEIMDKKAAIRNLSNEFVMRLEKVSMEEEMEEEKAQKFDESDWDGAASNWDTAEAYCNSCLLDFNSGDEKTKSLCKLPYRKPGSTLPNKNAIKAIGSGARGLPAVKKPADVPQDEFDRQMKSAASKVIGWWSDAFETDAPEEIYKIAGKEQPAEKRLNQLEKWIEEIKGFLTGKKSLEVKQSGMKFTKDAEGRPWVLLWSTNSFEDREKEIFTTQSIDDFIERHEQDDTKGEVWFCHLPGSKFANIKMQARVGRFLLEAAQFDDSEMGHTFAKFFEDNPEGHPKIAPNGWGQSHGYRFQRKDRIDGIYHSFEKYESTILPWDIAANQHNPRPRFMNGGKIMNEKQKEAFENVFGEGLVSQMVSLGETKTAELEATGVAYKEVAEEAVEEIVEEAVEEPVEEEKEVEETVEEAVEEVVEEVEVEEKEVEEVEEEVKEIPISREEITEGFKTVISELTEKFEAMVDEKVSAAVDELVEVVVPIAQELKALKEGDEQKIARAVETAPAASLSAMMRESIIGKKENHVDGRTAYAKDGPEEAEKSQSGPVVAGTKLTLWK